MYALLAMKLWLFLTLCFHCAFKCTGFIPYTELCTGLERCCRQLSFLDIYNSPSQKELSIIEDLGICDLSFLTTMPSPVLKVCFSDKQGNAFGYLDRRSHLHMYLGSGSLSLHLTIYRWDSTMLFLTWQFISFSTEQY